MSSGGPNNFLDPLARAKKAVNDIISSMNSAPERGPSRPSASSYGTPASYELDMNNLKLEFETKLNRMWDRQSAFRTDTLQCQGSIRELQEKLEQQDGEIVALKHELEMERKGKREMDKRLNTVEESQKRSSNAIGVAMRRISAVEAGLGRVQSTNVSSGASSVPESLYEDVKSLQKGMAGKAELAQIRPWMEMINSVVEDFRANSQHLNMIGIKSESGFVSNNELLELLNSQTDSMTTMLGELVSLRRGLTQESEQRGALKHELEARIEEATEDFQDEIQTVYAISASDHEEKLSKVETLQKWNSAALTKLEGVVKEFEKKLAVVTSSSQQANADVKLLTQNFDGIYEIEILKESQKRLGDKFDDLEDRTNKKYLDLEDKLDKRIDNLEDDVEDLEGDVKDLKRDYTCLRYQHFHPKYTQESDDGRETPGTSLNTTGFNENVKVTSSPFLSSGNGSGGFEKKAPPPPAWNNRRFKRPFETRPTDMGNKQPKIQNESETDEEAKRSRFNQGQSSHPPAPVPSPVLEGVDEIDYSNNDNGTATPRNSSLNIINQEYIPTDTEEDDNSTPLHNIDQTMMPSRFVCVCGREFNSFNNLTWHIHCHASGRQQRCNLCSRTFDNLAELTNHLSAVHKKRVDRQAASPRECNSTMNKSTPSDKQGQSSDDQTSPKREGQQSPVFSFPPGFSFSPKPANRISINLQRNLNQSTTDP